MAKRRPRVVSIEWIDPLMLGGTWMPELIELAGGVALGASAGQPAPTIAHYERFWDDHLDRLKRHLEKGDQR